MSEVGEGDRSGEQRTVQEEVARLEAERLRRTSGTGAQTSTEQPSSSGDASGTGTTVKVTSAAGRESLRQETVGDLWADEEENEYKDAQEERDGDGARAEHRAEEERTVPNPGEQQDGDARYGRCCSGTYGLLVERLRVRRPGADWHVVLAALLPGLREGRAERGALAESQRVGAQPGTYGEWGATVKTEPKVKLPVKKEPSKTATWTRLPAPSSGTAAKKKPTGPSAANRTVVARTSARNAYNLSSMVSNVMKVLPVFYSDTATMEKARDFWELFEAHTAHLPDQSRLFVRFHNQFLSRTADELWERLQTTKRERGESVEKWGDRVSDLWYSLDYPNPQMRYQLFRRGLCNKRMLATLDSGPSRDIPEACEWLLAKEMSRPIEEDDEFPEEKKSAGTSSSSATASPTKTSTKLDKLAETISSSVALQQQWQRQMMRNQWQPPRSPRNRMPNVSATTSSPGAGSHASPGISRPRGIRMGADSRTQEGAPACGRCGYVGNSRESCRLQVVLCNQCGEVGHIAVECEGGPSRGRAGGQVPVARYGGRGAIRCNFCQEEGHMIGEERVTPSSCLSNDPGSGGRDRDEVNGTVSTVNACMKASGEQAGTVPAEDEVSCGESKDEIKKKEVNFIVVSTDDEGEDLAVKVDELERKEVYEDLGLSAIGASIELKGWVVSADDLEASGGVEHRPVELAGELIDSPYGEEIPEETSRAVSMVSLGDEPGKNPVIEEVAQKAEAPTPFADEPTPFADEPPPRCVRLAGLPVLDLDGGGSGTVEAGAKNGTVPLETTTASNYDRLFSDEELIAMENAGPGQEASVLVGADVVSEPEEYDKKLEDRLYPLDEVELLRRVARNVEAQAEPSSEELARILGISLEVLERTRQASSDLHGSPEYWQGWFEVMLDKSEEAKRANRDFRSPVASVVYGPPLETEICSKEPPPASGIMSEGERESVPTRDIAAEERVVVESVVAENVVRPPDDPGGTVAVAEAVPVLSEVRGVNPKVARAVARQAVFRFLKEARSYGDGRSEASGPPAEEGGTVKVPPPRDKVPEFDEGRLLWHVDRVKELMGVKARSGERLRSWMRTYFADNSRRIWLELWNRTGWSKAPSARRRRRRHPNKVVTFDFSSLYKPYAEAIDEVELFPERDEDASHNVEVVRCERPARSPLPKTGLVDVVTVNLPNGFKVYDDDGAEDFVCRVLEDGRRVVCAVGNFEALSSGYIDCLPSQMLADTGLVMSSSGHKLRTRGWIRLATRLGSEEISLSLLVADKLHVEAILGVDALGAFGAVIDVAERSLTLKGSGEVLPLGFTVVQESYITAMATSVRLPPRGQALVRTRVVSDVAEKAVVLVEGSLGLPPSRTYIDRSQVMCQDRGRTGADSVYGGGRPGCYRGVQCVY
ncbi:unnamed protein product [Phytophthora fragariaefolia]|uniref:Unnamed protein product n=1 Tax=Phytophthora fragariaefolia TaxID=1490495 RepID=A0A9W6WVS8_9STRA|nr:unnamed protein product [Phytophthora fragariaefolia]